MTIKKKVLVPVDFDAHSKNVVLQAVSICKKMGKNMHIIYVAEDSSNLFIHISKEQKKEAMIAIEDELKKIATAAGKNNNIEITTSILTGKPYQKILETAKNIDPAFIIMGANNHSSESDSYSRIGTNTSKVVRASEWPVLTVSKKVTCTYFRSILVPLDLTKETRQKVTMAITFAKKFNAKIKVVSALWSKNNGDVARELTIQMNQVLKFIRSDNIECEGEIIKSSDDAKSLVPIILKYADEQKDIDLIMIMTQQELAWVERFIGSTALELLRKSPYPVLSIIPKQLGQSSIMNF